MELTFTFFSIIKLRLLREGRRRRRREDEREEKEEEDVKMWRLEVKRHNR